MEYVSGVVSSVFSVIFMVFLIAAVGYLLGAINIKGISLGTAGVLLAALLFGILASFVPSFTVGEKTIALFDEGLNTKFNLVCNIGTVLFVSAVGMIAGPKFFRSMNKSYMAYIVLGVATIAVGAIITGFLIILDKGTSPAMEVGLMSGALTSTPAFSAAKEALGGDAHVVTAGYGIAYLFGVLGVVLFVQIVPRMLKINMAQERERFVAAGTVKPVEIKKELKKVEPFEFFPLFFSATVGCIIGAIKIPGIDFSLGNSGGCLLSGLLIGHFGHLGKLDMRVDKRTLAFFRELGLVMFLIGSGVPGGVNFVSNVKVAYFLYGVLMTAVPMVCCFLLAKYIFKLDILNSLGAVCGCMTCTSALGALIASSGTDEVTAAYATTYPVALVSVVIAAKVILLVV